MRLATDTSSFRFQFRIAKRGGLWGYSNAGLDDFCCHTDYGGGGDVYSNLKNLMEHKTLVQICVDAKRDMERPQTQSPRQGSKVDFPA